MTVVAQGSGTLEAIPRPKSVFQRNLNLVRELSITSFKLKYTGSALGYIWSLIKPLMLFGIMFLVFSILLRAGSRDTDFPVQLLIAIVAWTFFTEATSTAMNAVAGNGDLIRKAYFPRWILVVASTTSALLTFAINTTLVLVVDPRARRSPPHTPKPVRAALLSRVDRPRARPLLAAVVALRVLQRPGAHLGNRLAGSFLWLGSRLSIHAHQFADAPRSRRFESDCADHHGSSLFARGVELAQPPMVSLIGALEVVPIVLSIAAFGVGFFVFTKLTPKFAEAL